MKTADQDFMTQMRIHELEIQLRKDMVGFTKYDGAYSLSTGIAQTGPDTFLATEDFVPEADAAMYESKKNPGSQITIHRPVDACLHAV